MARKKKSEEKKEVKPRPSSLVAKRDFVICHNDYCRAIKEGDDLSDVPEMYLENLKTEGVL